MEIKGSVAYADASSVSWLTNPTDASRHPWRSAAFVFVSVAAFFGPFAYFRWTPGHLVSSVLVGLGFGLVGSLGTLGAILDPQSVERMRNRRFGIDIVSMGAGVGIILAGLSTGNLGLSGAGLPLLVFGLGWYLIKRYAPRR